MVWWLFEVIARWRSAVLFLESTRPAGNEASLGLPFSVLCHKILEELKKGRKKGSDWSFFIFPFLGRFILSFFVPPILTDLCDKEQKKERLRRRLPYSAKFSRGLIFAVFVVSNPTSPRTLCNEMLLEPIPRNISASKISYTEVQTRRVNLVFSAD